MDVSAYLQDESGLSGQADTIVFPENAGEARDTLLRAKGSPVTIQGARTGLFGGAVPRSGMIINMSRLKEPISFRFDAENQTGSLRVQVGRTLEEIETLLHTKVLPPSFDWADGGLSDWNAYCQSPKEMWFLPNPTEKSATLGGICAMEACGPHIQAMENWAEMMRPTETIQEGDIAIFTELELKLSPRPALEYGLMCWFSTYSDLLNFHGILSRDMKNCANAQLLCMDYFDASCFDFLREYGKNIPGTAALPTLPQGIQVAMWVEFGGAEEDALYEALELALAALEASHSSPDIALAATDARDYGRLRNLRHALTEAANGLASNSPALITDLRGRFLSETRSLIEDMELPHLFMGHMKGPAHLRIMAKEAAPIRAWSEKLFSQHSDWVTRILCTGENHEVLCMR